MAAKGTPVSPKEVVKMRKLFLEYGSYVKVAKKMRRSPATVSKWVQKGNIIFDKDTVGFE